MELGRAIDVNRLNIAGCEVAVSMLITEAGAILPKGTVFEIRGKVGVTADNFGVAWYANKRMQDCGTQVLRIDGQDVIVPGELRARVPVAKAAVGGGGGFLIIARLEVS